MPHANAFLPAAAWYLPFYLYAQGAPGFLRSASAKSETQKEVLIVSFVFLALVVEPAQPTEPRGPMGLYLRGLMPLLLAMVGLLWLHRAVPALLPPTT